MEKINEILVWIENNPHLVGLIGLLVIELFLRWFPTYKDVSILNRLYLLFDAMLGNSTTKKKTTTLIDGRKVTRRVHRYMRKPDK